MKHHLFSKFIKTGFISVLLALTPITRVQADSRICQAFAKIAHGSVVARDEKIPIHILKSRLRAELSQSPLYDTAMMIMEKSYYGFPNATPEEAYVETLLQCQASLM